jgi:hypothetical protein
MEKKKTGRREKYGEPTIMFTARIPAGSKPGLVKLLAEYLKVYQQQKILSQLNKEHNVND